MEKALSRFKGHLRNNKLRLTDERIHLLKVVMGMKEHFGPEDLLKKIKEQKLNISRATVYRLIPVLVQAELIQQSLLSEGVSKFEVTWNREHHDHLICSLCNKVVEFHHGAVETLQNEIAKKYGFTLEHHVMELVGKCGSCQKKHRKN